MFILAPESIAPKLPEILAVILSVDFFLSSIIITRLMLYISN